MQQILLSRTLFRERVLARRQGQCCVPACAAAAVDAHHILNRRLFTAPEEFGGYFMANGAQLCSDHHYQAELTRLATEDLREWCGSFAVFPKGWDADKSYDTWGNEVISAHELKPGPLFNDPGFQKVAALENLLWKFYNHTSSVTTSP